jgi:ABC-type Na+ efflux pump permease subunit
MAWMPVLVVSGFMLVGSLFGLRSWGGTLHFVLLIWALSAVIQPALRISVGLFSEERRNRTLELLFLTGMNSGELFMGKLLGAVLVASNDVLALVPLLAVPFLGGGVSFDLFVATIACLPALLFFLVTVGVLASVMCKDDSAALVFAGSLVGIIALALPIPYNIGQFLTGLRPFASSWLCLSPAFGPYLVWKGSGGFDAGEFWASTGVTVVWSILCLGLAAVALKRNWRRDVEGIVLSGWRARLEPILRGSESWRLELRNRVLDENPFQWLVLRDRRSVMLSWLAIGCIGFLWLLGWLAWPRLWLSPVNLYSTAFLLLVTTATLRDYAAARRLGEDRRDGALELLLTTSLTPEQIIDGQVHGSRIQFRPIRFGLLVLFTLFVVAGLLARHWNIAAVAVYLSIWVFFYLICFRRTQQSVIKSAWIALNSGRPALTITGATKKNPFSLFWILYNMRNITGGAGGGLSRFPSGSVVECCLVIGAAVVIAILWPISRLRRPVYFDELRERFINEMRSIAQEPVPDPKDSRFKEWKDMDQRFPGSPTQGPILL